MSTIDDATLLKMAEAEILGEAKRAAVRHSIAGVSGWQPCPKPNKTFLTNTLLQTMTSNRLLTRKKKDLHHKQPERKLLQKKNKADLGDNFVYQKPKKSKEKSVKGSKTSEFTNNKTDNKHSKSVKKCSAKVKLKKS